MSDGEDPLVQRAQARVGSVLNDKWTLNALLGVGGMAAVYAGTHRNKKRGAVKLLHAELSHEPSVRERFLREGYVANTVDHPGAVRVDDDDVTEDGAAFLVMELLEGETLDARAQRKGGRLPLEEVLPIADQLLDTLTAAHGKGIVHRDLKPENLFLTREGVLKVLDFGIARLREQNDSSTATQTGSTMGTPAFMAPEQARGRWDEVDARTDLWAVGASLFNLLTGRLVFEAQTTNEMLGMAMMHQAPPLSSVLPDVSPGVAALVDRSLAYDKAARFQDAAEMQAAVRALIRGADLSCRLPALSFADAQPASIAAPVSQTTTAWTEQGHQQAPAPTPKAAGKGAMLAAAAGLGVVLLIGVIVATTRGGSTATAGSPPSASLAGATDTARDPSSSGSAGVPEIAPVPEPTPGVVSLDDLPSAPSASATPQPGAPGQAGAHPPSTARAAGVSPKISPPPKPAAPLYTPPKPAAPKATGKPAPDPYARRR